MSESLPAEIAGYSVRRRIARTQFSEVFEVTTPGGERLCLKCLLPSAEGTGSELAHQFHNEAKLLAQVSHPSVVKVVSIGTWEGRHFICLEFIEGGSLSGLISATAPVSMPDFFEIALQLTEGLSHIHQKEVIHRDLKPDNILVKRVGESWLAKIADFGLSSNDGQGGESFVGTLDYVSPEQAKVVDWPVDARSDLYSLGVLLYELATGHRPFGAKAGAQLLSAHLSDPPIPPLDARKDLPPLLNRVLLKLLEKRPEERYQSAQGLHADLLEAKHRFHAQDPEAELELDRGSANAQKLQESFVGREGELKQLLEALQKARARQLTVTFVGGHAGVGKSALLREFSNRALISGARIAAGKNYEFSRALPYFCLGEALEDFRVKLSKAPEGVQRQIRERVQAGVRSQAADLVQVAPGYRELFPEKLEVKYLGEERDRQRLHEMVHAFLDSVSLPMAPLILLLDDLQWADNGLLILLESLISSEQRHAVTVLCTYRSEERVEGSQLDRLLNLAAKSVSAQVIDLQPFSPNETALLVSRSLSHQKTWTAPPALVEDLFERTQGNAFFITEVLKVLLSGNALVKDGESWAYDAEQAKNLQIPADVVSLVLRRLDLFEAGSRRLLGEAAWIGTGFSFEQVSSVHGGDPDEAYAILRSAVARRILQDSANGEYRFCHDRIHEACKNLVKESDRPEIHLRIVQQIERSDRASEQVFQLAEHSLAAGDRDRIRRYCQAAGEEARKRLSNSQALRYFEMAMQAGGAESVALRLQAAELLALLGRYGEAIGHYESLLSASQEALDRAKYLSRIAECLQRRGEYEPAKQKLHQSLAELGMRVWSRQLWLPTLLDGARTRVLRAFPALFRPKDRDIESRKVLADALRKLWFVHIIQDIRPLRHISSRLLAVTTPLGCSEELAVSLQLHAMSLANSRRPSWKSAIGYALQSVEVGREAKASQVIAGSMVRLAAFSTWRGDHAAGLTYSDRAREMLTAIGNIWDLANAHIFGFLCRRALGDLGEALGHASTMVELAKKTGSKGTLCSGQIKIGEILHLQGNGEEAMKMIEGAISTAEEAKLGFDAFQGHKALGQVHLRNGRYREALQSFQRAIDLLEQNGGGFFFAYHSEAYLGWAEAALKGSDANRLVAKARAYLSSCRRLEKYFKETGHVLRLEALLLSKEKRAKAAAKTYQKAIALFHSEKRLLEEAVCRMDLGESLSGSDTSGAIEQLKHAQVLFQQMGALQPVGECARLLRGLGENTNTAEDSEKSSRRVLDALLEIGVASVQSLNPLEQARAILDKVNQLMNADRALLFLWDERTQSPRFQIGRSREGADIAKAEGYSSTIIKRAMAGQEPVVVAGTEQGALLGSESAVVHHLLSMVAVPILLQQKLIGALYLDHQMLKGVFTDKDAQVLLAIAQHIGVAIQVTRLTQLEVENKELEKNLEVTRAVQSLLLPKEDLFRSKQLELAAFYCSASRSGGDWWGFEDQGDGRFTVMMGDVTGHGPGPAMITAAVAGCIGTFRETHGPVRGPEVEHLLKTLDRMLHALCHDSYWMTFSLVEFDLTKETFTYWSSAAPPVFKLSANGEVSVLSASGAPLGSNEQIFGKIEGSFEPGAKILLFSDGVHEMKAYNGTSFGIKRTRKLFQECGGTSAADLRGEIWSKLQAWKGDAAALEDDVTFLILEHLKAERKLA